MNVGGDILTCVVYLIFISFPFLENGGYLWITFCISSFNLAVGILVLYASNIFSIQCRSLPIFLRSTATV